MTKLQENSPATGVDAIDPRAVRRDFPILEQTVRGKPLVYLDNAATTQKPLAVIEALDHYYRLDNSNIHRGVHQLSERATKAHEEARLKVQRFLNAASHKEIIFTRGTTESINLVAATFGRTALGAGDEILITGMEHHSNIVPWQILGETTGTRLRVIPISDDGEIDLAQADALMGPKTRLLSVVHVSNSLGTVNPVKRLIELAHAKGIPVLLDGAQAVAHMTVDVRELDCDFYAFSGHKIYGPTGIGVLYGKEELLKKMPPYQGGGDMIASVTFEKTTYNALPYKFEAGTPHIAGAIGLGAAIDYLRNLGLDAVARHEAKLLDHGTRALREIDGLRLVGTARERAGVLSFVLDSAHPHDVGTILDQEGVAVRTGHHCCQPVMERYGIPATARASIAVYNTEEDIDALVRGIYRVMEVFG